jgi:hypothetical protein
MTTKVKKATKRISTRYMAMLEGGVASGAGGRACQKFTFVT